MRLPETVVAALNSKITATQDAMKVQNEVAQAKAQAEKAIAIARGEAEANRQKMASITPQLLQYEAIQKWNGVLPSMMTNGGSVPFINLSK
jgi:regulator of protease activity HflC (stomatin/prohibitin superfamily)